MRKTLADIVCCPVHRTRLALRIDEEDEHGDVVRGAFHCGACAFDYPIEKGIPNLLPPEYHVAGVREPEATGARHGKRGQPAAPPGPSVGTAAHGAGKGAGRRGA